MYQSGGTAVLGVSVLPATGQIPMLRYAAMTAIVIGVSAFILQLALSIYRATSQTK